MRRLLLTALVSATLVAGVLLSTAPLLFRSTYSVQQVNQGLRLHPHAWVNRTVLVRAVSFTYFWGSGRGGAGRHQDFLVDPPVTRRFLILSYGTRAARINAVGLSPALLTTNVPPPPSAADTFVVWIADLPVIGHLLFRMRPEYSPKVYHVHLVRVGPCPPTLGTFCPFGTIVP